MNRELKREKYLIKNTAIFAIGNLSTKFIAFFLVPLYTYVLSREEYGIINLIFTVSTVISPFLMLNMQDAVRRFSLDKCADHRAILTNEVIVIIFGHIIGLLFLPLLKLYPTFSPYSLIIYFYLISATTNIIVTEYLRGLEMMKAYAVCSIVSASAVALLNILFLVKLRLGIKGYFMSYIIAYYISSLMAVVAGKQYKVISQWKYDSKLFKEMIRFSLPMIPNSLLWWVSSSFDHIMVTHLISATANGIYTVSYKVPTMISTLSNIFMQAWQISAIKDADEKDSEAFSNKLMDAYIRLSVLLTAGLLLIIKPFMAIYVSAEYFEAWRYAPFLIVGNTFLTLGTFVGTSYYVKKDMKGNMCSACSGAVFNVIMNLLLIPLIGVQGAAIATCMSYVVIFVYRIFDTKKYLKLNFLKRKYVFYLTVVLIMLALTYVEATWHYAAMAVMCAVLVCDNISLFKPIIQATASKFKRMTRTSR